MFLTFRFWSPRRLSIDMRFGWGKLVVLLFTSVAVLQIIHVLLLNLLEVKTGNSVHRRSDDVSRLKNGQQTDFGDGRAGVDSSSASSMWKHNVASISKVLQDMVNTVQESSVLDSSGEFRIIDLLVHSDGFRSQKDSYADVTLVTQCSFGRLPHLVTLSQHWNGPISVAVFATKGDLVDALVSIAELRQCFPTIRHNTTFHLVYPLSHHRHHHLQELVNLVILKWSSSSTSTTLTSEYCEKFSLSNKRSTKIDSNNIIQYDAVVPSLATNYEIKDGVPYPNNLLRNVARRNALTEFFFLIDVDMVPSENLHHDFLVFAESNRLLSDVKRDDKTVYVVPAFEAREEVRVPTNKKDLLTLIDSLNARPFYFELCWKCQKHTDYDAWQREPITPHLKVVFEVLWKDPWEPFYIARNSVPLYDERFKQYGFNRISQVCELHVAGYRFSVLNNAFLIHSGLKTVDSFHKKKDEDQERNRLLFRQFKSELKEKYPDSSRRCY
ncbi:Beta-1,4-glucuronyltransferase 1 [Chamberlinius hualienensis]